MNTNTPTTQAQNPPSTPSDYWLLRDEEWGVYVGNDCNNNLVVQVAHFKKQHQKKDDGTIVEIGINPTRINQWLVPTEKEEGGKKTLREPNEFKRDADLAISKAKQQIEIEKMKRERIQGVLVNYWPQAQKFNQGA